MATSGGGDGETSGLLKNAFVGNVSRHTPLPAEHRKSAKRGNLQFDACFEGGKRLPLRSPSPFLAGTVISRASRFVCYAGNLGRVDYVTDHEYDLFIRPDTCNPRFDSDKSLVAHVDMHISMSLCSRHNPNEGGRTAISANWVEDTQAQLSAMMATVPHCHRQPFFIEQSEAILAGPRDATHLPTWRYF